MKNKFFNFLLPSLLLLSFWSCKKEENRVYLESSNPVTLSASSTSAQVLQQSNAAKTALTFSWNNPNYRFTTGMSSQDVTYTLQVDTTGANFSSPSRQEVAIARDLSVTYSVKDLNAILLKGNLLEDMPHAVEFRVKASIGNSAPVYSNVVKMNITPYLDVAVPLPPSGDLYITGSAMASDWTNSPPANQKFTKVSKTLYTITVPLEPGKQYKFLSNQGQWQPQYGGKSATGGELGFNMGSGSDPDAVPTPSDAGNYKITVDFKTGNYKVEKQ